MKHGKMSTGTSVARGGVAGRMCGWHNRNHATAPGITATRAHLQQPIDFTS